MLYVRDHFRIQSIISEAYASGTCELACCKIKSRNGLVTLGGIYRSPCCLADDFILRHICYWSMAECCFIIGDFKAPRINWIGLTAPGGGFDSDLLSTVVQCALVQCMAKPTHTDLKHDPSLLELALTHHCEDVFDIQHLPSLVNSDHVVLHFKFRTHGIQFVYAPPRPIIWRANILAIRVCAISTDWSVEADGPIEDEWNKFKATFESVTSPFIPWSARKLSH
ncbi:Vacuolar protein sorting-associated protein 37C, variant 3 [Schistosoma haematobium]|uniref:Vacuolar protein sorting-associated protein 37C, variant 3 n=1 Tax=Schistosoma haematobium TaxID=6185 RepID=A0A922IRL1_SCHHA|nr:Vacuolar protein sorting-associated protein 37C, variant 3 [Schistosoma haematobium]KAH9585432.1 Vacuolar protein sorting-associated protein 37C, variant 3 [Schistosoma haematobium]